MLSASSVFSFTGNGGIWLIMPGIFVILHKKLKISTKKSNSSLWRCILIEVCVQEKLRVLKWNAKLLTPCSSLMCFDGIVCQNKWKKCGVVDERRLTHSKLQKYYLWTERADQCFPASAHTLKSMSLLATIPGKYICLQSWCNSIFGVASKGHTCRKNKIYYRGFWRMQRESVRILGIVNPKSFSGSLTLH